MFVITYKKYIFKKEASNSTKFTHKKGLVLFKRIENSLTGGPPSNPRIINSEQEGNN